MALPTSTYNLLTRGFNITAQVSTTLGEHPVTLHPQGNERILNMEVWPLGDGFQLTDFHVDIQYHPQGGWVEYLTSYDFVTRPEDRLLWVGTIPPHQVAEGQSTGFTMIVAGANAVRFRLRAGEAGLVRLRGAMRPSK